MAHSPLGTPTTNTALLNGENIEFAFLAAGIEVQHVRLLSYRAGGECEGTSRSHGIPTRYDLRRS